MSTEIETTDVDGLADTNETLHPVVAWLEAGVRPILNEIHKSEFWQLATAHGAEPAALTAFVAEVYREIAMFQPQVHEAAIAIIAQMPRSMEFRQFRAMLVHQAEEFDHGEMARRDYVGLGLDVNDTYGRMSPEAFAVSAVWWMIARERDPFAYFGALFLFEGLTPQLTSAVIGNLRNKGFDDRSLEYMKFHSTEDFKHAALIRQLISRTVWRYPESEDAIKHGFHCLAQVYPIPLLAAAFNRSRLRRAGGGK